MSSSSGWQGKSKGNKTGYSIFVWTLRNAGLRPAYWLLRFVAFYYFLFSKDSARPILALYRDRLGFSPWAARKMLYRNYVMLGQTIIDKIAVMAGFGGRFQTSSDGLEHLQSIAAGGKGGILISAHMGNWEIAGHLLKKLGKKINLVMYDGEHEAIKSYLNSVTGEKSFNIITIQPDNSHIFKMAHALAADEFICMHADRFIEGNKTLEVSFLGKAARFPEGPFLLGAKMQAPVTFVYALKKSDLHYAFSATPPVVVSGNGSENGPHQLLLAFVRELEDKVKKYPDQWFNYYDFWK